MDRLELEKIVISAIQKVQAESGEPEEEIDLSTIPINGLAGFESLRGLEVSHVILSQLEPDLLINLFISDDGTRALNIREAVTKIQTSLREGSKRK